MKAWSGNRRRGDLPVTGHLHARGTGGLHIATDFSGQSLVWLPGGRLNINMSVPVSVTLICKSQWVSCGWCNFTSIKIPMITDCLIFIIEIPIPGNTLSSWASLWGSRLYIWYPQKLPLLTISRLWRYCGPSNYRFDFFLYWYAPWVFFEVVDVFRVPHLCSKIPKIYNWSMDNGVHSVCFRGDFAIKTVVGFLR